jgi:hypothetical protein
MDPLTAGTLNPDQDFDEIIRNAQNEFMHAANLAGIAGDPAQTLLRAFTLHLSSLRAVHFSERRFVSERLNSLDSRLATVKEMQDDIKITAAKATKAAEAEINAAHAKMGKAIVESIASEVKSQISRKARAAWVTSIVFAAGFIVAGIIGGTFYGYQWGKETTAKTLHTADKLIDRISATQGVKAVTDWNMLMRYNPIVSVMKECHGHAVSYQQYGRKACQMAFWIAPVPQRKPPV